MLRRHQERCDALSLIRKECTPAGMLKANVTRLIFKTGAGQVI
ncbi:hypothetical protein BN1184_AJ_00040 [Pantoea ananatis]|nr:hypothetical protein BN1184_AJ_00040 [Pantoea ananatis]